MLRGDMDKVKTIIEKSIQRGEIRGDINVSVVAAQYFSLSIGLAGDIMQSSSVEPAIRSLEDQLNQLYYLLRR
jgi:hypothetical protein